MPLFRGLVSLRNQELAVKFSATHHSYDTAVYLVSPLPTG